MKKILVVDDDERILSLICSFLKKSNFETIPARDVAEAESILKNHHVDLIILDVMMPGTSGLEFARSLRAASASYPVVMLTALTEESDQKAGIESGADKYMIKPFDPKALLRNIKELLHIED